MSEEERDPALARLDAFVGEWKVEASFEGAPPGHSVFEWALHGQFLVQRSEAPDPAPDGLMVVAHEAGTDSYTQHYYDSRGVVRLYAMTFDGTTWTLKRETPDFSPLGFHQRYTATFDDDGGAIRGTWEISHDEGTTWERDFDLGYTRVTRPASG
jgi:hypothetical protein